MPATYRSRMQWRDALATGTLGLRSRRGRTLLTAIGIAIGIASMVAVLGISASSKADLIERIDQLGTNLLVVEAGESMDGQDATLPTAAPGMVRRIAPVEDAASLSRLNTTVERNPYAESCNGIAVFATEPELAGTVEATARTGRLLDAATAKLPTVVLGSVAAERLGISDLGGGAVVTIGGKQFTVIGILDPLPLNPELDRAALIGQPAAAAVLGAEIYPTSIYVRSAQEHVTGVRSVLARTVNPANPEQVLVSRPSDALAARAEVDTNLQQLLLGLGAVALLVGGVGIANVMIISVLERRGEIGLRRALGATRRHITTQFVLEAASLSTLGGVLGVALGSAVTFWYATSQGWQVDIPVEGLALGVVAALLLGALAGVYPAVRAARLDPAEAIRPA